jgi:2-keto-3-deoxy-L-rhamnonate aldolase RhmA
MRHSKTTHRKRFLGGKKLIGSFLKIAHTMPAEILATAGYDFVVIDEEHAPVNRETTDSVILACLAHGLAVSCGIKTTIRRVLSLGWIMVPMGYLRRMSTHPKRPRVS